jgi:hypothetical protein
MDERIVGQLTLRQMGNVVVKKEPACVVAVGNLARGLRVPDVGP